MIPDEVAARWRAAGDWGPDTLASRFAVVCRANAARVALVDGGQTLRFADVAERVERLAAALAASGVRAGDVVSWQLPNWWEAAVVHHAALRAGAVPNPLNPAFRARELAFVLREARPAMLAVPREWRGFEHAALAERMRADGLAREVVVVRGDPTDPASLERFVERARDPAPPPPPDPAGIALLLYTSGTTGDPKGVQHSHRSLLCEISSFRVIHALTAEDRYLGGAPVAHIAGLVYGILTPFALGTSTALLDRWDPGAALRVIERDRATFMTGPPTFLQTLAAEPAVTRADRSSFRLFSTGGASIPTERVREAGARLGCLVKRAYGSTEVPTLTATTIDDDEGARLESDGRPIGGAEMRTEGGEIWARAPEMLAGYRNLALDREAFDADGWFRTGDLGSVDERGLLHVVGRIKDIIIRGGENISAKEVEDLLLEHPAVADAAVVAMPDPVLGERACAFVALRDGAALAFEEMAAYLSSRDIARHKVPERLEVRASLPKTESGKVRKADLRAEVGG